VCVPPSVSILVTHLFPVIIMDNQEYTVCFMSDYSLTVSYDLCHSKHV
jgi:hypothetical protein